MTTPAPARCRASAVYGSRRVDVSACTWPAATYLLVRVRGPGGDCTAMEFVIDAPQSQDVLSLGLQWGRDFVEGRLH